MGIYNFKPQFVPFIEDWSKRHTIRAYRQHDDVPGKVMYNYVGLRHPGARCLMRPQCVRTDHIRIEGGPNTRHRILMGFSFGRPEFPGYGREMGGPLVELAGDELQQLAWRDGFRPQGSSLTNPGDAFGLMMQFWTGRFPFEGSVRHWNPAKQWVKTEWGFWKWEAIAAPSKQAALARCDRELAAIAAQSPAGPSRAVDAAMGQLDWEAEKRLIEQEHA